MKFTAEQQAAACRALLARSQGQGPPLPGAVVGAARSICECEDLSPERQRRLAGLQQVFADDPSMAPLLGLEQARVNAGLVDRLARIDIGLRAQILAIADKTLTDTAERIDIEIQSRVDRSKLRPEEVVAFDTLPFRAFLDVLREPARARLTLDEEDIALLAARASAEQVEALLASGTFATLAELEDALDTRLIAAQHELDRPRAVSLFQTSLAALLIGRLGRAVDSEDRTLRDAVVPEGVARDTLEVAGGAGDTEVGGLPRRDGIPTTPAGDQSRGANLAQGHSVSEQVEIQLSQIARRTFRHSGKADGRAEHVAANGAFSSELEGTFPGQHFDCGCSWEITFEDDPDLIGLQ
jgi:hypothetical protein